VILGNEAAVGSGDGVVGHVMYAAYARASKGIRVTED
jgi:hypothetical protein